MASQGQRSNPSNGQLQLLQEVLVCWPVKCCVPFCLSESVITEGPYGLSSVTGLQMFRFPTNQRLAMVWYQKIQRICPDPKSRQKDYVCALHFQDHDFLYFYRDVRTDEFITKMLRPDAIPNVFLNIDPLSNLRVKQEKNN